MDIAVLCGNILFCLNLYYMLRILCILLCNMPILIFFWKKLLTFGLIWCNIIKSPILRRSNGSIAQLGEHLPYKQRVIGSSPIVPTKRTEKSFFRPVPSGFVSDEFGPIVQLVRTPPCHGGGRGFESHSGRQFFLSWQPVLFQPALAAVRRGRLCSSVGRAGD